MATTAEYLTQLQTDKATLVTNLVAKGVDATNDETFTTLVPKVADISTGGSTEPIFTGHYDAEGLKQIGWSDEEIDYYQQYWVQWDSENDYIFKLTSDELLGNDTSTTRFIPKNTTKKSFSSYSSLLAIPLIDFSNITSFNSIFSTCMSLIAIPLINTSKGTNFNSTFRSCKSLKKVPLLNTSNAKNMSSMFDGCVILEEIPQFNTSKVQNFQSIFWSCPSLKTIPKTISFKEVLIQL